MKCAAQRSPNSLLEVPLTLKVLIYFSRRPYLRGPYSFIQNLLSSRFWFSPRGASTFEVLFPPEGVPSIRIPSPLEVLIPTTSPLPSRAGLSLRCPFFEALIPSSKMLCPRGHDSLLKALSYPQSPFPSLRYPFLWGFNSLLKPFMTSLELEYEFPSSSSEVLCYSTSQVGLETVFLEEVEHSRLAACQARPGPTIPDWVSSPPSRTEPIALLGQFRM